MEEGRQSGLEPESSLQLGDWRVERGSNRVCRGDEEKILEKRAMDVLCRLAGEAPRTVTADELLDEFWAGMVVEQGTIHRVISKLRGVLEDHARNPRYIETVPKRGYRVIAEVVMPGDRPAATAAGEPQVAGTAPGSPTASKIAVMPFKNMSGDPEQLFFCEGLAEDVLNCLAALPDIKVKAQTSSFALGQQNADLETIRERLDITHVVQGSVRRSGTRVRVNIQLVDAREETLVWSGKFDRVIDDIFTVQDEITASVRESLGLELLTRPRSARTINPDAYDAFLLGRYYYHQMDPDRAIAALQAAVDIDPEFAAAHSQLAWTQAFYIWWGLFDMSDKLPIITRHAELALAIDPDDHTAQVVRATNRFFVDREYQQAIDDVDRLIRQRPDAVWSYLIYGSMLHTVGRSDLGVEAFRRAVALDPMSPNAHRLLAEGLLFLGQHEAARKAAAYAEQMGAHEAQLLVSIALEQRDFAGVMAQLERPDADWGLAVPNKYLYLTFVHRNNGDVERGEESLRRAQELRNPPSTFFRFNTAMLEPDLDTALILLEQMLESSEYLVLRDAAARKQGLANPYLHADPRFNEILVRAGIDADSFATIIVPPLPQATDSAQDP